MFNSLHYTLGTLLESMRRMSYEMKQIAGQELLCSILEKWLEILKIFRKVVPEGNRRNQTNVDVIVWLYDVENVIDNLKDILDEFELMAARQRRTTGKESSLTKIIPARFTGSNRNAVLDGDLSSNIMDITNRLEELDRTRNALGLRVIPGSVPLPFYSSATAYRPYPESVFPNEPAIYGRDRDKMDTIMDAVKRLKEFNTKRDALEIMTYSAPAKVNLNEVLVQLKEALVGRKFLLVLDDVLSKNYGLWETVKSSLIVGAPGSKVIMTTRGADLMISMESNNIQPYNLEVLPDDDCWSVFAKYAFERDCDA
ncbi:hypothetical protein Pint_03630 [Pistacia integerrima]|uniref:Uncharacterized protein n=1 Tax=Pistacia integerrima TaxID=434235 RepID=A0ACC0Z3G6_9ROSI|nr:hypothetical protein Pint_03630 [Pistacia integerrima]